MRALASFIMAGRLQAMAIAVGFGLLGFLLPPLSVGSGAAIALVGLRKGPTEGALILVLSSAVLAGISLLLMGVPLAGVAFGLLQWGPVWLVATLLRKSGSWPLTLQSSAAVAAVGVLAAHVLFPDLVATWRALLDTLVRPMFEQNGFAGEELERMLTQSARWMTGALAASFVLGALLSLILARAWQAVLYNPGGFREEFHALRAGLWPALMLIALMALGTVLDMPVLGSIALAIMPICLLQGVAVVHGVRQGLKWPAGSLIGFYVLMVLPPTMPYLLAFVTVLGVIDAFTDIRRKLPSGPSGGD